MDADFVTAMAIGLLTFGAVYLSLDMVFRSADAAVRKVKAIFAGAAYLVVTVSLWRDPALLNEVTRRLTWELLAVVFALLFALRTLLRRL